MYYIAIVLHQQNEEFLVGPITSDESLREKVADLYRQFAEAFPRYREGLLKMAELAVHPEMPPEFVKNGGSLIGERGPLHNPEKTHYVTWKVITKGAKSPPSDPHVEMPAFRQDGDRH